MGRKGVVRFRQVISALVLMLVAGAACPGVSAQVSRIDRGAIVRGQVRFADGSAGPRGVMVTMDSATSGTVANAQTDDQGKFTLTANAMGVYIVHAKYPGYEEVSIRVDMTITPTTFIEVKLIPVTKEAVAPTGEAVSVASLNVPDRARKEFEKGRKTLLEDKDPEHSVSSLRKAVEIHPAFAEAHFLLGTAYMDLKKWPEAQASLEKAVEHNEKYFAARLALGTCLAQQGNFAAAEAQLKRGLELNPETVAGQTEMARVLLAQGKWQDAEPCARKAIALNADEPIAHVLLGNILLRKREPQGALDEFNKYLKLDPKGPFAPGARDMVSKIEKALAQQPK